MASPCRSPGRASARLLVGAVLVASFAASAEGWRADPPPAESWRAALAWQGIGADKGLQLGLDTPLWLGGRFGFYANLAGQETVGLPPGQTELRHLDYLLMHAGVAARGEVVPGLEWVFRLGPGLNWPEAALDGDLTASIEVRTGLSYLMAPSLGLSGFLEAGVEANLWNRADGFQGRPFFGRGTAVLFGLRVRF